MLISGLKWGLIKKRCLQVKYNDIIYVSDRLNFD